MDKCASINRMSSCAALVMGLPANMPREVRHLITFKTVASDKTEMTVTEYGYTSEQNVALSRQRVEQCLNKMAAALAKK